MAKIAFIGRNGIGKTTLFKIIAGLDKEYQGIVEFKSGLRIVLTEQEHFEYHDTNIIDYILKEHPKYSELKNKIRRYENGDESVSLEEYCDILAEFY